MPAGKRSSPGCRAQSALPEPPTQAARAARAVPASWETCRGWSRPRGCMAGPGLGTPGTQDGAAPCASPQPSCVPAAGLDVPLPSAAPGGQRHRQRAVGDAGRALWLQVGGCAGGTCCCILGMVGAGSWADSWGCLAPRSVHCPCGWALLPGGPGDASGEQARVIICFLLPCTVPGLAAVHVGPDTYSWPPVVRRLPPCSVQTVKRKHRHAQEALNNGTLGADKGGRASTSRRPAVGPGAAPLLRPAAASTLSLWARILQPWLRPVGPLRHGRHCPWLGWQTRCACPRCRAAGKRQHHRKQTPYRWMIVRALGELPNYQVRRPPLPPALAGGPACAHRSWGQRPYLLLLLGGKERAKQGSAGRVAALCTPPSVAHVAHGSQIFCCWVAPARPSSPPWAPPHPPTLHTHTQGVHPALSQSYTTRPPTRPPLHPGHCSGNLRAHRGERHVCERP